VCPYCTTPLPTPTATTPPVPSVSNTSLASKIPDLSVIAEVAHQIITDQVKASSDKCTADVADNSTVTPDVNMATPQQQPEPSTLDLNSLICLADVSEKMDVS